MKIFIPFNGHANKFTFPLRFGYVLEKSECWNASFEDEEFDPKGTEDQRKSDRDKGRKHYLGTLIFESPEKGIQIREKIRGVLEMPTSSDKLPLLVTVLGTENTKGDNTISPFLEGLHQKGKITTEEIRTVFHKAYVEGRILNANDVQEIFESEIQSKAQVDRAEPALQQHPEVVAEATNTPAIEDVDLHSPMTVKPLPIPGVKLTYAMANAYIENVRISDDKIWFDAIDENGQKQSFHSFKLSTRPYLSHLHDYAFEYFKEREEQRAVFAFCTTDYCFGFIAESVTAISLQMMKAGKA